MYQFLCTSSSADVLSPPASTLYNTLCTPLPLTPFSLRCRDSVCPVYMTCVHDAHVTTPWLQSGIQSIAEPYSKSSLTRSSRSLPSSFPVSAPRLSPRLLPVALFHTALLCILQLTRQNSTAFAHLNFALSLLCILSLSLSLFYFHYSLCIVLTTCTLLILLNTQFDSYFALN